MKKKGVLIILFASLLLGILFPFAAITEVSTAYKAVFNFIFDLQLSHVLMHAALFAGLSWVVMALSSRKTLASQLWLALACVFLVAVMQEAVQMLSTRTSDFCAALFDIGVDLGGGVLPLMIHWVVKSAPKETGIKQEERPCSGGK